MSKYGIEHPPIKVCPLPFYFMAVTADGDIRPCCAYEDPMVLGNVWNVRLAEAWNKIYLNMFRKMMLNGNRSGMRVCKNCLMPDAIITPGDELDERAEEIRRRME